jgi:two-component system response regulator AtoC
VGTRRVLLADDDVDLRRVLSELLIEEGYDVTEVASGDEVVTAFQDDKLIPDLALIDVRMPGSDGIEVLRKLRSQLPRPMPIIIMTGFGTSNVAIEATQLGAFDYIIKPFELESVLETIRNYFEWHQLNGEAEPISSSGEAPDPSNVLIGSSPAMQVIYKTIGRVAASDATVLITGETGTGKELIATLLHRRSAYARGPLIKVNCAALPETLLESELFGHEKGAFTSAIAQRKGRFELADKGSIFLDEIGEMTLATQKKLLRVLQEREFERVGGTTTVMIDTRVIAATNKHLPTEIAEGRFREDLYYRLNIISIHLPPLRERQEDIPMLVEHFLHQFRTKPGAAPSRITKAAIDKLMQHSWPGNIRELQNVVERAVVMSQGGIVTEEEIDFTAGSLRRSIDISQSIRDGRSLAELLATVEREAIIEAIARSKGDREAAATLLDIDLDRIPAI